MPHNLNYEVSGDRLSPAVLFLHGFMGSSADWREVMAALGDRTFRIAMDLPGHGASLELAPDTYTVEGAARAVIRTLDGLEVVRPVVAGYSMGGRLALYLALRYPERCAGLFLESASPGLENSSKRAVRRAADESKAQRLESGDLEAFLRDWYRQPLFASLAQADHRGKAAQRSWRACPVSSGDGEGEPAVVVGRAGRPQQASARRCWRAG